MESHGWPTGCVRPRANREGRSADHVEAVGQRIPPDHHVDEAGQDRSGPEGVETARTCGADVDVAVQRARRESDTHQFQRGVFLFADPPGRGAGESACHHQYGAFV